MEIVFKFEALIQRETIHFYQMEIVKREAIHFYQMKIVIKFEA
jgi:hypothetical protein